MSGWSRVDRGTRVFWKAVGRPVDLDADPWLRAPVHTAGPVGDGWLEEAAASVGGTVVRDDPGAGLLPDLAVLDGPSFSAAALHPLVRDFYEHTATWRMDAWSQWSPLAAPGGSLVAWAFGRRVQQLAIPVRPLDVSRGIDSRVLPVRDAAGEQVWAGWLRRLRATDDVLFSGAYRSTGVPGREGACVHVAFPLEQGNVQVFLAPTARADGALVLDSGPGRFGDPGAYVLVLDDAAAPHAARVPVHERFAVFVDEEGVLRTDHDLRVGPVRSLRLHYRMTRA
ncbi:hypothetical protein [Oryzobacter terrae]|uniref:hypothetical protein n=1 Tax=Oryzobacter terrae TaxID=1620385 RepID=UPI00366F692E